MPRAASHRVFCRAELVHAAWHVDASRDCVTRPETIRREVAARRPAGQARRRNDRPTSGPPRVVWCHTTRAAAGDPCEGAFAVLQADEQRATTQPRGAWVTAIRPIRVRGLGNPGRCSSARLARPKSVHGCLVRRDAELRSRHRSTSRETSCCEGDHNPLAPVTRRRRSAAAVSSHERSRDRGTRIPAWLGTAKRWICAPRAAGTVSARSG